MLPFDNLVSQDFENKMNEEKSYVILDVRTQEEFSEKRIPNAINIDIYQPTFREEIEELDREQPYYVYCRSGKRSANACLVMKQLGFSSVTNLEGGILGWEGSVVEQN